MRRQKIISFSWIFTIFFCFASVQGQSISDTYDSALRGENGLRIMFYNVENLFDTFDDPAINDEEFTPGGDKRWSYYRYKEKLNNLAKVIMAVGGWEPPDVIGLCEVENFQVLFDLTTKTPLKKYGYQIVHENSRDSRGIDNAILYLSDKLSKIEQRSFLVDGKEEFTTRDILYSSFSYKDIDTLHLFVNHWPSRFGGKEFTESKRFLAAKSLRKQVDSIQISNTEAKVFIMGDFNDEPEDKSLQNILMALSVENEVKNEHLYNLSLVDYKAGKGTLVYKEIDHTWFLFDQMIVSGTLLDGRGLQTLGMKNHIFGPDWLLKDGRPFRSYQGPIYRGGFSDHLPIFLDLYYKE